MSKDKLTYVSYKKKSSTTDLRIIYKCKTTQENLFKQENKVIMITEFQPE